MKEKLKAALESLEVAEFMAWNMGEKQLLELIKEAEAKIEEVLRDGSGS